MDEQQKINWYQKSFNYLQKKREKNTDSLFNLQIKNIEQIRGFLLQVTLLSVAIFIAVVPLLKDIYFLKGCKDFAWFGLILLGFNALFGVWHMNVILTRENRSLDKLRNFHDKEFDKYINLNNQFLKEQKSCVEYENEKIKLAMESSKKEKEIYNNFNPKNKYLIKIDKYFTDILTWIFILGAVMIFFSFIKG